MERCNLMLVVPTSAELLADSEGHHHHHERRSTKEVALSKDPFTLDIWRLEAFDNIDPRTLSWSTKPRRLTSLAQSHVKPGKRIELESPEFYCAAGSLVTFEVTCTSPLCHLAFEQDVKSPKMGEISRVYESSLRLITRLLAMYIVQHQSIFHEDSIL